MNNKTIIGILLVLVAIGGLAWWGLRDKPVETPVEDVGANPTNPESLTVNHYFENGKHTIEGTMTMPTPCHTLTSEVTLAPRSSPSEVGEQIMIKFTTKAGEGMCTQVLADKFFRVTFNASRDATIRATLNGQPLELKFSETLEGITK